MVTATFVNVSWIESERLLLVEYLGERRPAHSHGNSKSGSEPYIRKAQTTMDYVTAQRNVPSGKAVYDKLIKAMNIEEAPRNSRVVSNKRTYERAKERAAAGKQYRLNFADEVVSVLACC